MAKNGAVLDNFGSFWDKFGNVLDNLGVLLDYFGSTKTPKNRIFNSINKEKQTIHTVSSRYNASIREYDLKKDLNGNFDWY